MSYNIILTLRFEKELKRLVKKYRSLKNDFSTLIDELEHKPETGVYIGNDCYKIRLAISSKNKGKSGGARLITYLYLKSKTIYLLSIYDKSEKENISPTELNEIVSNLNIGD